MNRAIWMIPTLGLTFWAGWLCHRPPAVDAPAGRERSSKTGDGLTVVAGNPTETTRIISLAPELRPLDSLAEILEFLDSAQHGGGELGIIPAMGMLPRLMITDAATVQRLLGELEEVLAQNPNRRKEDIHTAAAAALIFRWMTVQPEPATVYALEHRDSFDGLKSMVPYFMAYTATARPGSEDRLLAGFPDDEKMRMPEIFAQMRLMADPAATLRDPAQLEKLNDSQVWKLTEQWARKDSSGLLAWRTTLPEGPKRDAADRALLEYLARSPTDPQQVGSLLPGLPPGLAAAVKVRKLGDEIQLAAGKGKDAAADPSTYAAKLSTLLAGTSDDPQRSLPYVVTGIGRLFSDQKKYTEGVQWAQSLPAGEGQDLALSTIAGGWASADASAASAWIDTLPVGSGRDRATGQLIDAIKNEDPSSALVWAGSMSNKEQGISTSRDILNSWFQRDPVAASVAVQSLPPDQQQRLIPSAEKPGNPRKVQPEE